MHEFSDADLYSESNSNGIIDLSLAENRLSSNLVAQRLSRVPPIEKSFLGYSATIEEVMAKFASKYITQRLISPENILITCGASGALDQITYVLCDPGDQVIVVAPGYKGFKEDLAARNRVKVLPVQLSAENEFRTTVEVIENKWNAANDTSRVKAIILSSPGNPSVSWARSKGIHAVFDEIYALSVFAEGSKFISVAEVLDNQLGNDVHIIWSLSKDFCASGLRAGFLLSQNKEFIKRLKPLDWFGGLSSLTGWALIDIFGDTAWIDSFIQENNRRILCAYENVTSTLEKYDKQPICRSIHTYLNTQQLTLHQ